MNDEQEKKNPPAKFNQSDIQKKLKHIEKRSNELKEQLKDIEENGDMAIKVQQTLCRRKYTTNRSKTNIKIST